jgi:TonB family protein
MTENATLKIAASISLGIHLLFFAIVLNLFQYPKPPQADTHYVQVILHPLTSEEKSNLKMVPPVPLRVGDPDPRQPTIVGKGPDGDSFSHRTSLAKAIFEEPMSVPKNKEEEEIPDEPTSIVAAPESVSAKRSDLENGGNGVSSEGPGSNGENSAIALPVFRSGEFDGGTFAYNSSGDGKGSGNGTGHIASLGKGAGKGGGIPGKMFSSRGGSNGGRPRYIDNPKPAYPQEAREKGHQGEVVLRVEVLVNGRVGQIEIKKSSGYELLDHSALTTVKQWRFVPAKKGEVSIPLWVNIPIKFQLQ